MRPTQIQFSKLVWLSKSEGFRSNPIRTLVRIGFWEIRRIIGKCFLFRFDDTLKVLLCPEDGIARLTYYFEFHEPEVFSLLNAFLKEGMVLIDVGANIGTIAMFAAKRVGSNGKVYAFEPQSGVFARLHSNVELNNLRNITIENLAVGEQEGLVDMYLDADSAKSHVRETDNETDGSNVRTEKCPVVTLDKYAVDKHVTRIDYLKIDVEGYEYNVLVGCSGLIDRYAPSIIQVELLEEFQERVGHTSDSIVQLLRSKGYHPHFFDQLGRRLLPFSKIKSPRGNAFFAKNIDSIHGVLGESRQE